jgi:hypothetical protein
MELTRPSVYTSVYSLAYIRFRMDESSMRLPITASALLAFLCLVAVAQAAVVHDFSVELRDEKPYGAATLHLTEKIYDTTGAVPPAALKGTAWLPKGISIRPQFLKKPYVCNLRNLKETKNPSVCRRARIGTGKALIDLRPLLAEPFPVKLQLFLAKPITRGAVASYAVFGIPDERAPIVRNSPGIRDARAVLIGTIFSDPTPDGLYGYRMEDPFIQIGIKFRVAEAELTLPGLTMTKRVRTCARPKGRRSGSRCRKTKSKVKRIFWVTAPNCPASRKLSWKADLRLEGGISLSTVRETPCPRFARLAGR